jgi:geranylgeranyl pyrophosphate synthase
MAAHLVRKPGKRVRAAMVLFSARAGHADPRRAAQLAAVVEMLHLASLVHDDILDGSAKRRDQRSLHKVWGTHLSVLMGDYLFTRLAGMLTSAFHREVLKVVIRAAEDMVLGEIEEEAAAYRKTLPVSGYLGIIRLKTAELMAASCEAGATLAGAPPAVRHALRKYGLEFGMGFQVTDDALDFSSNERELGKPVGGDLGEGRFTYPVLCLLGRLKGAERRRLLALLSRSSLSNGGSRKVIEMVRESGCVPGTLVLADRRFASAIRALRGVPAAAARPLAGLAEYAARRTR